MINILRDNLSFKKFRKQVVGTVGFVPTMGNLHQGHLKLIKRSLNENDHTIVSIFVNPTQFGEGEDFNAYPRTWEADLEQIKSLAGPIAIYAPMNSELYPEQNIAEVKAGKLAEMLEGNLRPGHFDGVLTVVQKLFKLVEPERAYFGKKDYQQLKVIHAFTHLNFPKILIVPCETIRETNGLALSSRNGYLTSSQKDQALTLYESLSFIEKTLVTTKDLREAQTLVQDLLSKDDNFNYLTIRKQSDLMPPLNLEEPVVILGNYQIGSTKLIDNIEVQIK